MGTPGDKDKIGEVVGSNIQEQSNDGKQGDEFPRTVTPAIPTVAPPLSEEPSSTLSEMTIVSELSHFETFIDYDVPSSIKSEPTSQIDDYFAETKYYPSVENLQPLLCTVLPSTGDHAAKESIDTLRYTLIDDRPGPSGLQTQKTNEETKPANVRKRCQSSPKKPYTCDVCQKTFPNATKLAKHQQSHVVVGGGVVVAGSGNNPSGSPFKCDECKKTFTTKFKLLRHALIHSDRKQFSCTVCERTFHRKDHLKNHIKVHSPSKTLYVCEKANCRKEYTSHLSYKKHLALHAAEAGSLECQICAKVFASKEEILYHLKIHAGSRTVKNPNEKKYTCDHCDRRFFTRKDVRRHLVVHTGMRDFLCQYCPQRFGRKDHLVRHIKKSHKDHVPTTTTATPSSSAVVESATDTTTASAIKAEKSELGSVKSELSEISESSLSNPDFGVSYLDTLFSQDYEPLELLPGAAAVEFLPHSGTTTTATTATSATTVGVDDDGSDDGDDAVELKDLGSEVLEAIVETAAFGADRLPVPSAAAAVAAASPSTAALLVQSDLVVDDPELLRLLQPDDSMPLPGFSQTFQSPPQQQQQPPQQQQQQQPPPPPPS